MVARNTKNSVATSDAGSISVFFDPVFLLKDVCTEIYSSFKFSPPLFDGVLLLNFIFCY